MCEERSDVCKIGAQPSNKQVIHVHFYSKIRTLPFQFSSKGFFYGRRQKKKKKRGLMFWMSAALLKLGTICFKLILFYEPNLS